MLNQFYRVAFRKKVYRSIDELQADLDAWIREYNEQRWQNADADLPCRNAMAKEKMPNDSRST